MQDVCVCVRVCMCVVCVGGGSGDGAFEGAYFTGSEGKGSIVHYPFLLLHVNCSGNQKSQCWERL